MLIEERPRLMTPGEARPLAGAALALGLHHHAECAPGDFPRLRRALDRSGAHWLAVRLSGPAGYATRWLVWGSRPASRAWRQVPAGELARALPLWLAFRRPDEWAASASVAARAALEGAS